MKYITQRSNNSYNATDSTVAEISNNNNTITINPTVNTMSRTSGLTLAIDRINSNRYDGNININNNNDITAVSPVTAIDSISNINDNNGRDFSRTSPTVSIGGIFNVFA